MGKYHENNKVPGYYCHKGNIYRFVVNRDQTISPTISLIMVWGINDENDLVYVKNSDTKRRLVFDKLN